MDGKVAKAPCGHLGRHVIGQYVQCPLCDVEPDDFDDIFPEYIDPEETKPLCRNCGSDQVEIYPDMVLNNQTLWHCTNCLRSFLV